MKQTSSAASAITVFLPSCRIFMHWIRFILARKRQKKRINYSPALFLVCGLKYTRVKHVVLFGLRG